MSHEAPLHCYCLDFSDPLDTVLAAHIQDPNTLLVCSATTLKHTVNAILSQNATYRTWDCLTYKELLFLNDPYPQTSKKH